MSHLTILLPLPVGWTSSPRGFPEMVLAPTPGEVWIAEKPGHRIEVAWLTEKSLFLCRWFLDDALSEQREFVYPHEVVEWLQGLISFETDQP